MKECVIERKILPNVFGWMFIGLWITFITAYAVSINPIMLENVFWSKFYIVIIVLEIFFAIVLSTRIYKMKGSVATCLYLSYTFLTGLTFSTVFITFNVLSVIIAFLITAILFGLMSFVGSILKVYLSKYMTFFLVGLVGVLVITIINLFILKNPILDTVLCVVMICMFLLSVAQKIQSYLSNQYYASIPERNAVIMCAFGLYMDFIIIFRKVLRLMQKRKK